jgi:cholest-4-en-3-one 26-monooxygenase
MTSMRLEDIDLVSPDTFADGPPHELFARLRREAPVFLHRRPNLPPFWVVAGHQDVVRVSRDWSSFSSQRHGAFLDEPPEGARQGQSQTMVNLDPPAHTRLRGLVGRAFTRQAVELRTRRVRAICTVILDRVCERGECDFVRDIAAEFSLAVVSELLGFPDEEDRRRVRRLTTILSDPLEQAFPDATMRASMEIFELAADLASWRRRAPGDDLVSVLTQAQVDGERLTQREFELFFLLLATAGHLTTRHLISGAMLALFEHPRQWRQLGENPALLGTGVEEMLRWVSPAMQFQRTATQDTEIGGQAIAAGDRVALYYISANRDESVFEDPVASICPARPTSTSASARAVPISASATAWPGWRSGPCSRNSRGGCRISSWRACPTTWARRSSTGSGRCPCGSPRRRR